MSSKYRIHGARFLRKYTADSKSSIYAYMADVRKIADTLCKVPWTRAADGVSATMTLHTEEGLDWNAAERERFDAAEWCAEHSDGLHRAYAQAACYVFEIPAADIGKAIEKIGVMVTSDPYNPYGARISALTSDTLEIPMDCATVRTGDVYRAPDAEGMGAAPRLYVANADGSQTWYANSENVELVPSTTLLAKKYLFVFCCLENYNRARNGWIEGSSYIENDVALTLSSASSDLADDELNDLAPLRDEVTILAGGAQPTWIEPPAMVDVGTAAPVVSGDTVAETFFAQLNPSSAPAATQILACPFDLWKWLPGGTSNKRRGIAGTVRLVFSGKTLVSATLDYTLSSDAGFYNNGGAPQSASNVALTVGSNNAVTGWSGTTGQTGVPSTQQVWSLGVAVGVLDSPSNATMDVSVQLTFGYDVPTGSSNWVDSDASTGGAHQFTGLAYTEGTGSQTRYLMLRTRDGVPVDADICTSAAESSRMYMGADITAPGDGEVEYTVDIGNYTGVVVWYDDSEHKVKAEYSGQSWAWDSAASPSGETTYFDASVNVPSAAAVGKFGLAAAVADFTAAVATFEGSAVPSDGELLGRLVRLSKAGAGAMATLHPANGALASELDALRPLPRFTRSGSAFSGMIGQPGISAWYHRASTGSTAATGYAKVSGETVLASVVTNPVFLQFALIALRSPAALAQKIVISNANGADVHNDFKLRFVAWRSDAALWDGSNSFALAAFASMPSVYRSDGPESVEWSADCSGALFPFGSRKVTAERVGVSDVVTGDIDDGAAVEIALRKPVGEGDVILIAPEIVGFASTESGDAYFGNEDDPSSAVGNGFAWARESYNIGWFPAVKGR